MRKDFRVNHDRSRRTSTTSTARRLGRRSLLAVLGASVVSACTSGTSATKKASNSPSPSAISTARVTVAPKTGAANTAVEGALSVSVRGGELTSVTVTAENGTRVSGTFSSGHTRWTPDGRLSPSTRYSVRAVAADARGREALANTTFTTIAPEATLVGYFTPEDGSTVGVGMPVSLNFNHAITDKEAVQKAVSVTSTAGVEIAAHWFGDSRLDFRPEQYWPSGTKVTLSLRLRGVEGASGRYGVQRKDVTFTVGRNQTSLVDAEKKTMTVRREGRAVRTIPITSGAPEHTTWNGKMVISEKYLQTRMDGSTVGFGGEYDIPDVPHAMRLTTSGTFVHGNYWSPASTFGSQNVSHGCVGLHDTQGAKDTGTPGYWFYENSLIGDVVEVVNSHDDTVSPDNGLNGWNMSWQEWRAGSALG
jgi:lipoprotein-anchoring transpeptidase ErfK/SrfK